MNLFTGLLNYAVTLSILDVSPVLLGVFAVIALAIAIILLVVRPTITYVDTEGDQEIHKESHPLLKKVALHGAAKNGKKLISVPAGKTGDITVPASVEIIGFGAFEATSLE